ncbi:tail fiber protein [Aquimarina macrocephali]|uniref:tail fiber protein n=1 Tax=Aquimarina macrocephali TaxID=666563 RepID=UPI0004632028|nr:tail fiber protein [Aquimarina macrocephali]
MKKTVISIILFGITLGLNAQITELSNGNVGIGTVTPDQTLVVNGRISFDYGDGKSYNGFRRDGSKTEYYNIITGGTSVIHEFTGSNGALMSLKNDGKIGIGTTNPNDKLHVNGDTTLNIYHGTTQGHLNFRQGQPVTDVAIVTAQHGFATYNGLRINGTNGVSIGTNNGVERLRVDSAGNVGIGTTSPDMKLTVKGNIHAEEVLIDLNVPAPDYVFKKDYNLRSIEEVEKFIIENSHLPEIPSAKEFEQNGVMQAEMDMNLLKKIEELTLYTIQQQKEIEELKSLVKKLLKSKE